jgi:hypothetical protein
MVSVRDAGLVQRVIDEIWNAGDLDLADELFGATYINHGGLVPDLVSGPEGMKFSVALYRRAFPDLHLYADELDTNGEMITLHWTARATSAVDAGDTGSSGLTGTLTGKTRISMAGGQIVESWTSWSAADALAEMGVFQLPDDETS